MFKSVAATLILIPALCSVKLANGDMPNKHLEGFDQFIGSWILQATMEEEDAFVPKGTKIIAYNEFKWTLNKQAVIFNWIVRAEGQEKPILANHLIVRDKKSQKITCFWQRSDGEQGTTDWRFEDGTLIGDVHSITNDGQEASITVYFRPEDADSYTWWGTDSVVNGEKKPDISKYTYVRIE